MMLNTCNYYIVQGTVVLNENGTRIYQIVRIKQYRFEGGYSHLHNSSSDSIIVVLTIGATLVRKDIVLVKEQENSSLSFEFLEGVNDGVVYPSKLNKLLLLNTSVKLQ